MPGEYHVICDAELTRESLEFVGIVPLSPEDGAADDGKLRAGMVVKHNLGSAKELALAFPRLQATDKAD
jgi:hypothetical protein